MVKYLFVSCADDIIHEFPRYSYGIDPREFREIDLFIIVICHTVSEVEVSVFELEPLSGIYRYSQTES